jgi:hypothetical protein
MPNFLQNCNQTALLRRVWQEQHDTANNVARVREIHKLVCLSERSE